FKTFARGMNAPASDAFAIVPDDGQDLPFVTRGLYAGGTGDVRVVTLEGSTATFRNLAAGTVLPVSASRVLATGTTASDLLGLV
ncbi:MAG: hypothetical protein AAF615_00105, partial [Pseudomonadota bacterium]